MPKFLSYKCYTIITQYAAMLRVLEDPELLTEMRKNAAPSVSDFINDERMITEYERIYQGILGQ